MDKTVPNDIFHSGCQKCAYCGVKTIDAKIIRRKQQRRWRFIFHCRAHVDDAERDIILALKEAGLYRQSDVLKEPLFAILPEDLVLEDPALDKKETGWYLNTSLSSQNVELVYHNPLTKVWFINLCHPLTHRETFVPVTSLKDSLPEDQHGQVDAFIARLTSGLYA